MYTGLILASGASAGLAGGVGSWRVPGAGGEVSAVWVASVGGSGVVWEGFCRKVGCQVSAAKVAVLVAK